MIRMAVYEGDADGRPGWRVMFDYDAALLARLKRAVPAEDRSFDRETKTWWFSERRIGEVLRVMPQLRAYTDQARML